MKLNKRIATATAVAATEIEFRAVAERNMLLTVLFFNLSLFFFLVVFLIVIWKLIQFLNASCAPFFHSLIHSSIKRIDHGLMREC